MIDLTNFTPSSVWLLIASISFTLRIFYSDVIFTYIMLKERITLTCSLNFMFLEVNCMTTWCFFFFHWRNKLLCLAFKSQGILNWDIHIYGCLFCKVGFYLHNVDRIHYNYAFMFCTYLILTWFQTIEFIFIL